LSTSTQTSATCMGLIATRIGTGTGAAITSTTTIIIGGAPLRTLQQSNGVTASYQPSSKISGPIVTPNWISQFRHRLGPLGRGDGTEPRSRLLALPRPTAPIPVCFAPAH